MNKIFTITKTIWQILIVFIEVSAVTSLLVYTSQRLSPFQDSFDIVERYIIFFAGYEILVYIILTFINDARQDALLALKSCYKLALLYFETKADLVKNGVYETINKQLGKSAFNHSDIREKYEQLKLFMDNDNIPAIKTQLLFIEHEFEMNSLHWNFTFLLRYFK